MWNIVTDDPMSYTSVRYGQVFASASEVTTLRHYTNVFIIIIRWYRDVTFTTYASGLYFFSDLNISCAVV